MEHNIPIEVGEKNKIPVFITIFSQYYHNRYHIFKFSKCGIIPLYYEAGTTVSLHTRIDEWKVNSYLDL